MILCYCARGPVEDVSDDEEEGMREAGPCPPDEEQFQAAFEVCIFSVIVISLLDKGAFKINAIPNCICTQYIFTTVLRMYIAYQP